MSVSVEAPASPLAPEDLGPVIQSVFDQLDRSPSVVARQRCAMCVDDRPEHLRIGRIRQASPPEFSQLAWTDLPLSVRPLHLDVRLLRMNDARQLAAVVNDRMTRRVGPKPPSPSGPIRDAYPTDGPAPRPRVPSTNSPLSTKSSRSPDAASSVKGVRWWMTSMCGAADQRRQGD